MKIEQIVTQKMTTLKWSEEAKSAVKDVRSDKSETTWAAVTYAENSMEDMVLLATGSYGLGFTACGLPALVVGIALLRAPRDADSR